MQWYTATEQGLEQIHYVSLCIWLQEEIARGNLQEEGCCRKYFERIISRLFKKSKMAEKVKQK